LFDLTSVNLNDVLMQHNFGEWYVKLWICNNRFCVLIISVIQRNSCLFLVYSLITDLKKDSYYNISEESKFFSPVVTAPLQTGNIMLRSATTKYMRQQPVLHRGDHLPNSAKWSTLSLVFAAWCIELTKIIEYFYC
jgi:hypothetical protein